MKTDRVLLDHGSGGLATRELVREVFLSRLSNPSLSRLEDSAVLDMPGGRIAYTTDSYVVDPVFFPGGDIGSLAVHGTVNDLAMQGARPLALSMGLILEEGLGMEELDRIARSIARACGEAGVDVVAADTKVVPRGKADKIFINTSGIGIVAEGVDLGSHLASPGDVVVVSGFIGDHGTAILMSREGLTFDVDIHSDSAPLHTLVETVLSACPKGAVRLFRDPTRGGLATVLNEVAQASGVHIEIDEEAVPVRDGVMSVCELLGLEPMYLANEGKCVVVADGKYASGVLEALKGHVLGRDAAVIGRIKGLKGDEKPIVTMKTSVGGSRVVSILSGEPLPRIC